MNNVGDYYSLNEFLKEGINWISVSIVGNNWMKVDIMKWTLNFFRLWSYFCGNGVLFLGIGLAGIFRIGTDKYGK